jgi:hypothetical protein
VKITYMQIFRIAVVAAVGWEIGKILPDVTVGVLNRRARHAYKTAWHRGDEYNRRSQKDYNKPTVVPDAPKQYGPYVTNEKSRVHNKPGNETPTVVTEVHTQYPQRRPAGKDETPTQDGA